MKNFYDELDAHDWFYEMSDDSRVYQNGEANFNRLVNLTKGCPEKSALLNDFMNYVDSIVIRQPIEKPRRPV